MRLDSNNAPTTATTSKRTKKTEKKQNGDLKTNIIPDEPLNWNCTHTAHSTHTHESVLSKHTSLTKVRRNFSLLQFGSSRKRVMIFQQCFSSLSFSAQKCARQHRERVKMVGYMWKCCYYSALESDRRAKPIRRDRKSTRKIIYTTNGERNILCGMCKLNKCSHSPAVCIAEAHAQNGVRTKNCL